MNRVNEGSSQKPPILVLKLKHTVTIFCVKPQQFLLSTKPDTDERPNQQILKIDTLVELYAL